MKKFTAIIAAGLMFTLTACGGAGGGSADAAKKSEGVMTYAEYDAAAVDAPVVIETYVQAKQSWWEN